MFLLFFVFLKYFTIKKNSLQCFQLLAYATTTDPSLSKETELGEVRCPGGASPPEAAVDVFPLL